MAPKSIKFMYFDARGRGEIVRLILAAAGQRFEDIRLSRDTWPVEKPKTPFGQLPVIELDGKRYAQSVAIATYCAREFGLYGKTNLDGLQIDQIVQLGAEYWGLVVKSVAESDENKKAELFKNLKEVEAPKYLALFEKFLKENGTGYFVGKTLTLADLYVYDVIYFSVKRGILSTDGFPQLQALHDKIVANKNIKEYLANRKETEN